MAKRIDSQKYADLSSNRPERDKGYTQFLPDRLAEQKAVQEKRSRK